MTAGSFCKLHPSLMNLVSVPGPSPDEPRDLESFLKKHSAIIPPSPRPTETIRRGSSLAPVVENPLQNSGTLIVTKSGRSRFMGRSAASEWLLDVGLSFGHC